jgi:hypothetical protein
MQQHAAKELRYVADILAPDATTVLASAVGAGIENLSGRRLEQAQLTASETTHMVLLRYPDSLPLPNQGYLRVSDPYTAAVTLYVVDYTQDPQKPRPRVWTEVYCHVERVNS